MANNGKDTKHIRHTDRRMHFVTDGEYCNFQKALWCEGGMKLADTGIKIIRADKLNSN